MPDDEWRLSIKGQQVLSAGWRRAGLRNGHRWWEERQSGCTEQHRSNTHIPS
jgi:hypothetical protein